VSSEARFMRATVLPRRSIRAGGGGGWVASGAATLYAREAVVRIQPGMRQNRRRESRCEGISEGDHHNGFIVIAPTPMSPGAYEYPTEEKEREERRPGGRRHA